MMRYIPEIKLSHGQVAWALSQGRRPSRKTLNHLRYLRLLGVPFMDNEQETGRGNRLDYSFDHLIECAVALYALRAGAKIKDIADILVRERMALRKRFRELFLSWPEASLDEAGIESDGTKISIFEVEDYLRLHDRYSEKPGKLEIFNPKAMEKHGLLGMFSERFSDDESRIIVPLKHVILSAVAFALKAPPTKPGPAKKE